MHAIIGFSDGTLHEGIVLAAGSNRMRIALREGHDTVELRRAGGQWKAENGTMVEFESLIDAAGIGRFTPAHTPYLAA